MNDFSNVKISFEYNFNFVIASNFFSLMTCLFLHTIISVIFVTVQFIMAGYFLPVIVTITFITKMIWTNIL